MMPETKPRTLRQLIGLLALVLVLPVLAIAAVLGLQQVEAVRDQLEAEALRDARDVLFRLDRHVVDRAAALRRAAADASAPAALHAATGLHVTLLDADGAALAETRPAPGLPNGARAAAQALAASGRLVSPLVEDPASGGHALLLVEPTPAGLLVLALPAAEMQAVLLRAADLGFGETRFPSVADEAGRIVARWRDADRFVGQPMPGPARAALLATPEGRWDGRNLAGLPVAVMHARSALSGLSVGLGITQTSLTEPYRRAAMLMLPLALLLLATALLATRLVARHIARPMAELGGAAAALADGNAAPRLATPIAEVNAVAEAMAGAAERRRAAEAQRDLLVRELHHRVKNLLTTAQSLATLSARTARDPQGFAAQFGDRLRALARTHTLLIEQPGGTLDLGALLGEVVAPYRLGLDRITLAGPAMRLPEDVAVPLGMVLHEMATNAAKYGALSTPRGRLAIAWRVEETPHRLVLCWTETGGPRVTPPEREGFGSQLLRRALSGLPGSEVRLDWPPEGLAVHITVGLREPPAPV